jgi:tetratricopeptide (TPR) repeat protein
MLDLGILPKLDSVFRLSFLGENASKAYTVAGAFIEWFRGQYGATALRRWYGGEELEQVVGQDLEQLEAKWRASIVEVEVNEEALHSAKARFDRPGIFERSCPHVVDELAANASERLNVNDYREARRLFEELLELDSHHLAARMGLGICALRAGQPAEAARRFEQVSRAGDLHRLERASGVEALADMSLARGDVAAAAKGYAAVAGLVVDEDHLRALDVKSSPPSEIGRQAIVALLVGDPRFGSAWDVAAAKLGQWLASEPEQGLPGYLLGKNLYNRGRLDEAAAYLDHGLARRIDSPRVMQEALRTRLLVGCALGQRDRARSVYQTLQGDKTLAPARRAAITRFAERCGLL